MRVVYRNKYGEVGWELGRLAVLEMCRGERGLFRSVLMSI